MNDLQFNVLFNSTSVILGQREGENERLCAMKQGPEVIKKKFMLNSAEDEIFPAYKC